jgi:TPP-dependent pyruvate/acetoin dehydrogenase alpha subunit
MDQKRWLKKKEPITPLRKMTHTAMISRENSHPNLAKEVNKRVSPSVEKWLSHIKFDMTRPAKGISLKVSSPRR